LAANAAGKLIVAGNSYFPVYFIFSITVNLRYMYRTENIDDPLYKLRRLACNSGALTFSSLKQWYNKAVFRDISIKFVLKGAERYYDSEGAQYLVKEGEFLLGSFEQHSGACVVESSSYVEGICLYIKPELLNEVYSLLVNKEGNDPEAFPHTHLTYPGFFNNIFTSRHTPLDARLKEIAAWFYNYESMMPENMFDEYMAGVCEKIVELQFGVHKSLARLDFLKNTTRKEIMKRLLLAKSYIEDNYLNNPTLDEIAAYAGISKYHFLRNFKLAYRQSPFEFIQDKRLQHAKRVIEKRERDLKDIASLCSFSDLAAFSKSFKRKFGVPPSAIQKMAQPKYIFIG
jgi:AraC family transcriptional regulator